MHENPSERLRDESEGRSSNDSLSAPAVNPDAAEFRDRQRLTGSSSVSAKDALLGGAPGPLLGDDTDTVNFPDNDPSLAAADNPDATGEEDADTEAPEDTDPDPDAPFADIGGEGGGPGAGPGPA